MGSILVKYFPPFDEATRRKNEEIPLDRGSLSVMELLERLREKHPHLVELASARTDEELRRQMIVAVGSRIARLSDTVKDGELVKILPPIAGGDTH